MAQQNIDFGAFPDDPTADPVRTAFQKVQNNFTDLYTTALTSNVLSVTATGGLYEENNRTIGELTIKSRIPNIAIQTGDSLVVGVGSAGTGNSAFITQSGSPFVIDVAETIETINGIFANTTTANLILTATITGNVSPSSDIAYDIGTPTERWETMYANNLSLTGNLTVSDITGDNLVSANYFTGTLTTNAQPNINSVGNLTLLNVDSNTTTANLLVANFANVLGNANVSGNIQSEGSIHAVVSVHSNNVIATEGVTGNLGTFDNVELASSISFGNTGHSIYLDTNTSSLDVYAGVSKVQLNYSDSQFVYADSTGVGIKTNALGALKEWNFSKSSGNLTGDGSLSAVNLVGSGNLSISGNAAISGNATITGNASIGNISTVNLVSGTTLRASGNVTAANVVATFLLGNGYQISSITGANVTGYVSNAAVSNVAGTVTTNAQPNVTSVGTLTSLTVSGALSGNVISGASISASGFVISSVNSAVSAAGSNQSTATLLTKQINIVTLASAGTGDGLKLPTITVGMTVIIINTTDVELNIYPSTGNSIDELSSNIPFTLGAKAKLQFIAGTSSTWYPLTAVFA